MSTFRLYILVWLSLLVLLGAAVASATLVPGVVGHGLVLLCAVAMATLIFAWFMGLSTADGLLRIFALIGLLYLAFLMGITLLDYVERNIGIPD